MQESSFFSAKNDFPFAVRNLESKTWFRSTDNDDDNISTAMMLVTLAGEAKEIWTIDKSLPKKLC